MEERSEQLGRQCPDPALAAVLRLAGRAALAAGQVLLARYQQPHQIRHKGAIDLVTEADLAAEQEALAILRAEDHGATFVSEESFADYHGPPAGPAWVIDPLDGTTNFAHAFPWFAVSIAYSVDGRSRAGVIYAPLFDELFYGWQGGGAWLNGHRLAVSTAASLQESLLATGFPYSIREKSDDIIGALAAMLPRIQGLRRAGAAALDLAYVAAGRLDGFWESTLKPWDTAAGGLLVEEAGGRLTTYDGSTPFSPYVPELLASNGRVHQQMARLLAGYSRLDR